NEVLGSARAVFSVGLVLGAVLIIVMSAILFQDRSARVDAARRQSMALATGVDRLLMYELRNIERAMTGLGIAGDAYLRETPDRAAAMMAGGIAGVLSRHPELASLVRFDGTGRAQSAGADDPGLPAWIAAAPTSK